MIIANIAGRFLPVGLMILIAGCTTSYGPRTIPGARFDYNEAISRSWDDQLLLNLVRLRYRDNPLFVDVSSITASYSVERSGAIGGSVGSDEGPQGSAGVGLKLVENPVISYNYLSGEEFAERLLSPITPQVFEALAQSGWSIERLLLCCLNGVNGIENAIAAAGPTPDYVPDYERFQKLAAAFRRLQLARHVMIEVGPDEQTYLYLRPDAGADGDEVRSLLGLDEGVEQVHVKAGILPLTGNAISVQGRSLLAVMYFLSQGVDVPNEDETAGRVTVTRDADGNEFDWSRVLGPLIHVQTGESKPAAGVAAVQVEYRGHWFWIDDSDLNSKTTFSLLRLLLFLKSGDPRVMSPAVTIPVR